MTTFDTVMYYLVNVFTFGALYWIKLPYKKALDEMKNEK